MQITEKLLTANGWELHLFPDAYLKNVTPDIRLLAEFMKSSVNIGLFLGKGCGVPLPRVRTLEQLAQLEWLLSDTYSASIETLPDFAQADARAVDRELQRQGTAR